MTNQVHWFVRSVFTTAALSNIALLIWAPFPILTAIVLMPYGIPASDPRVWILAVGVQVLFTGMVVTGRMATVRRATRNPRAVAVTLIAAAGAVRGAMLLLGSAVIGGVSAAPLEVTLRAINSALVALLALGLIGVAVQFTRDYRHDYEELRDRAMLLQREVVAPTPSLSDATIASWMGVQNSLLSTAQAARDELSGSDISPRSLNAAADVIADTLTRHVRPISHGLWAGTSDAPPRLRARLVAWDALRPWRPPVVTIAFLTGFVTAISAVNRVGVIPGLTAAALITAAVIVVLTASAIVGRHLPTSRAVGIATVLLTPPFVVVSAVLISEEILGTTPDIAGSIVLAFSITVGIGGTVFLRRVTAEREALLAALQARIDAQALDVLTRRAESETWGRSLGTFVHHSVQSELTALRMQLIEAAGNDDDAQRDAARTDALARFDRLLALQPPWVHQRSGREVVSDVARAWAGIATVDVTMTDAGSDEQWSLVGQLVEESVANAVRSGGARQVDVDITLNNDGSLLVTIADDGRGVDDCVNPGLGTWWLDQIAPDSWERRSSPAGTQLIVRVR